MKRKSTMVELVEELEKLPKSPEMDVIIAEARAGEFHDYKNKKYTCGKMAVCEMLRGLGHMELVDRIIHGEFDEEADEEDKAMMRAELEEHPELIKILGL